MKRFFKLVLTILAVAATGIIGFFFWYDYETGKCLKKSGDEAIAACTAYLKTDMAPEVLLHRGIAYQSKGQHDLAIADFTHYLRIVDNDATALEYRAESYHKKADFDSEIKDITTLISSLPKDPIYHFKRANAYAAKQLIPQARTDWENALKLPDHSGIHDAARKNLATFK